MLGIFGDSITTDHISPAGGIRATSPAGKYLLDHGVSVADFNTYGARRGNHEVMMRGTFANVRIKNLMVPGSEGGVTIHYPSGEQTSIYEAAMRYKKDGVPSVVFGGDEYGQGSSRDWAAKGPQLLGVKAVIVRNFERIHRANLVFMGVLPLQFREGVTAQSLKLDGSEVIDISGVEQGITPMQDVTMTDPPQGRHERAGSAQAAHRHADRGRLLRARRHSCPTYYANCSRRLSRAGVERIARGLISFKRAA